MNTACDPEGVTWVGISGLENVTPQHLSTNLPKGLELRESIRLSPFLSCLAKILHLTGSSLSVS